MRDITFTEALQRLDLFSGRPVSVRHGSDDAGAYPLLSINCRIERAEVAGAPAFKLVVGGDDSSLLVLTEKLFQSAQWSERDDALLITTSLGVLLITSHQPVGVSKRWS